MDLGGRDLALIEAADALRLLVWFNLIGAMFLPFGMARSDAGPVAWAAGIITWLARTLLFAAVAGAAACGAWPNRAGARGAGARCRGAARPAGRGVPVGRHGDRMIGATGAAALLLSIGAAVCPADRHGGVGSARCRRCSPPCCSARCRCAIALLAFALNGVALPVAIARMNSAALLTLRGNALVSWAGATVLLLAPSPAWRRSGPAGWSRSACRWRCSACCWSSCARTLWRRRSVCCRRRTAWSWLRARIPDLSLPAALAVAVPLVPALVLADNWLRR